MSDTAILVENLGKQYHISALQQDGGNYKYKSLRDSIANAVSEPLRAARAMIALNGTREDAQDKRIWALKDVSFEVKRGETIGVIGRNGAGKSTLLKLLARITEPTEGRAEIHGRTGSLLEVGTGFHPELSGRANIFLNGSIAWNEARGDCAAIRSRSSPTFAEVEDFIDTPVKQYSTGMYLLLAFAVAANLETEVLLVDEVLAVGDYRFQEKCLGKMRDIAATGRTILFVSHSMSSIQRLCKRAIAISGGKLIADSSPEAVIAEYIGGNLRSTHAEPASTTRPVITKAALRLEDRNLLLSMEFQSPFPLALPVLGFIMYNSAGAPIFGTDNRAEPISPPPGPAKSGRFEVAIPAGSFRPDRYLFSLWLGDHYTNHCTREMALKIDLNANVGGELSAQDYGNAYIRTHWSYEALRLN